MIDPWNRCLDSLSDASQFEEALQRPFKRALRLHPKRGPLSEAWEDVEGVAWTHNGYFHADHENPSAFLDYHTGRVYPQDAASQFPPIVLAPKKHEIILDACAAPGSKTTAAALAMEDTGCVIASDINPARRKVIRETVARQGLINVAVSTAGISELYEMGLSVDGALVDVPCSGHEKRSRKQVFKMHAKQLRILDQAAACVRPGGRLVYSTCTMYYEENEDVLEAFLKTHPDWQLQPIHVPCITDGVKDMLRFWPQISGTEPFFCALLIRQGEGENHLVLREKHSELNPFEFEIPKKMNLQRMGDYLLAANQITAALDIPLESRGLLMGEHINGIWKMNQWAAQACIERGAEALAVPYEDACALWSGAELGTVEGPIFVKTTCGAPLGMTRPKDLRLNMSSRAFRTVR